MVYPVSRILLASLVYGGSDSAKSLALACTVGRLTEARRLPSGGPTPSRTRADMAQSMYLSSYQIDCPQTKFAGLHLRDTEPPSTDHELTSRCRYQFQTNFKGITGKQALSL